VQSQVHWEAPTAKRRRIAPDNGPLKRAVLKTLRQLFLGKERRALICAEREKAAKDAGKGIRRALRAGKSLECSDVFAIVNAAVRTRGRSVASPDAATPERVAELAEKISVFILKLRSRGVKIKNVQVYTAALTELMSVGVVHQGVSMVPKLDWVSRSAPGDSQYSLTTGINSRAMSIAIRHLKGIFVSDRLMANLHLKMNTK
jgi:hypothetical protein